MTDDVPALPMDALAIRKILPHRYPFLLVDRVVEMDLEAGTIRGFKNVTQNEPFFQGHFPSLPVMPGVLQVEALAQIGAILGLLIPENRGHIAFLTAVEGFKFRRQVVPGDVLELKVEITRMRRGYGRSKAVALVDGEVAAEGELGFALGEPH